MPSRFRLAFVTVVVLAVTAFARAGDSSASKFHGTWVRQADDHKIVLEIEPDGLRCTLASAVGMKLTVEADYAVSRDGILVGVIRSFREGRTTDDMEEVRERVFCLRVTATEKTLTIKEVECAHEDVRELVKGTYKRSPGPVSLQFPGSKGKAKARESEHATSPGSAPGCVIGAAVGALSQPQAPVMNSFPGEVEIKPSLPALRLEVEDSTSTIQIGDELIYEVRVSNQGGAPATSVGVDVTIPENLEFTGTASPGSFKYEGSTVEFDRLLKLPLGSVVTYRLRVMARSAGDARVTVRLTADQLRATVTDEEFTYVYGKPEEDQESEPSRSDLTSEVQAFLKNQFFWTSLIERWSFGFIKRNAYSSDPTRRINELLKQSEDLRQIEAECERFWFTDQPSHFTPQHIRRDIPHEK